MLTAFWHFIYSITVISTTALNKLTEVLILFVVIVSDVNVSSNWRGYLAIWFSESSRADNGMPGLANCKVLPKVRNYLYTKFTQLFSFLDFLVI